MQVTFKYEIGDKVTVIDFGIDGIVNFVGYGFGGAPSKRYEINYVDDNKIVQSRWFDEQEISART